MKERFKNMDIMKLRLIVISFLVISFVLAIVLLKIGARHLGLDKGEYMPLLELLKADYPVVKGDDVKSINKFLGKTIIIDDRVKYMEKKKDTYLIKLTYITIEANESQLHFLESINKCKIKPGVELKACGKLKINPPFGLQLALSNVCYKSR